MGGNESATRGWDATDDSGAPVTGYDWQYRRSGRTWTDTASTACQPAAELCRRLAGLVNDREYEYPRARGEPHRGAGHWSEPVPLTLSRRIRGMSVVCLPVEDARGPDSLRAFIARNVIALLSGFAEAASDPPSANWLGRHSPRERIRGSGLWNDGDMDAEVDSKFLEVFGDPVLDTRSLASRPTSHWPNRPRALQRRVLPRRARHGTGR